MAKQGIVDVIGLCVCVIEMRRLFDQSSWHYGTAVFSIRVCRVAVINGWWCGPGLDQVEGKSERRSQEVSLGPGVVLWLVPRPPRRWCWRTRWSHQGWHLAEPTAVLPGDCLDVIDILVSSRLVCFLLPQCLMLFWKQNGAGTHVWIDQFRHFQARSRRRWPNLALVFWVHSIL